MDRDPRRPKLEQGLMSVDQVVKPAVTFLEDAHRRHPIRVPSTKEGGRGKKGGQKDLSFAGFINVWRALCKSIRVSMERGKGTRLENLGTFTLDLHGDPIFIPDTDFTGPPYNLRMHRKFQKGNAMISGVQFTTVAQLSSKQLTNRTMTTQVIDAIAQQLHEDLRSGTSSLTFQISSMGEFVIGSDKLELEIGRRGEPAVAKFIGVRFNRAFISAIKDSQKPAQANTTASLMAKQQRKEALRAARGPLGSPGASSMGFSPMNSPNPRAMAAAAMGGLDNGADGLNEAGHRALNFLKERLATRHGIYAVRSMRRILNVLDDSGDGELDREELLTGFRNLGVVIPKQVLEQLFLMPPDGLDADGSGTLAINEFYLGVRGSMNPIREKLVSRAFKHVKAAEGQGGAEINVAYLTQVYNCEWAPDVKNGKVRFADYRDAFIQMLDSTLIGPRTGGINKAKWHDYYQDVSATTPDDDYFTFMVREEWGFRDMQGFDQSPGRPEGLGSGAAEDDFFQAEDDAAMQNDLDEIMSQGSLTNSEYRHMKEDKMLKPEKLRSEKIFHTDNNWKYEEWEMKLGFGASKTSRLPAPPKQHHYDNDVRRLPANVFGDLTSLLDRKDAEDDWDRMRKILYKPPCSFEKLCDSLGVSGAADVPRISNAGLANQLVQLDRKVNGRRLNRKHAEQLAGLCGGPTVSVAKIHKELGRLFGRDPVTARPGSVLERVKRVMIDQCGSMGLRVLQDKLSSMDEDGNASLNKEELQKGLQHYNITLNQRELEQIFAKWDQDRSGSISFRELTDGIRGPLNPFRHGLIQEAYDKLSGGHPLNRQDLIRHFDCSWYPSVTRSNDPLDEDHIKQAFSMQFTSDDITEEDFLEYHHDLSCSIDGDRLFEVVLRNTWHIA